MKNLVLCMLLGMSSYVAADSKVILTSEGSTKGSTVIGLDVIAEQSFKAFQFDIDLTGATSVDLSSCTANMVTKMTISCVQKGNKVRVFAIETTAGKEIVAGKVSIGFIKVQGLVNPTVFDIEFADKTGEVMQSSAIISK